MNIAIRRASASWPISRNTLQPALGIGNARPAAASGDFPEAPPNPPAVDPANLAGTKPKPKGASLPPDFAAFTAQREKEREERRKSLPGGQVPAKDWFLPDPREPEIVRVGRVPGSTGYRRL